MALLNKQDLTDALTRLGQLAAERGEAVELLLVGGSLMVLLFGTRPSTRDLDVVILRPAEAARVRHLARRIAAERQWPDDWLNDAAKGYLVGPLDGPVIFSAPGITVRRPSIEQLLAMKLSAWRDDVDIADARRLLQELTANPDRDRGGIWDSVSAHLQPGRELKARYAFDDLWEDTHGQH